MCPTVLEIPLPASPSSLLNVVSLLWARCPPTSDVTGRVHTRVTLERSLPTTDREKWSRAQDPARQWLPKHWRTHYMKYGKPKSTRADREQRSAGTFSLHCTRFRSHC